MEYFIRAPVADLQACGSSDFAAASAAKLCITAASVDVELVVDTPGDS
jgi:hypothetical protein